MRCCTALITAFLMVLPALSPAAETTAAAAPSRNPFQELMNRKPRQITNSIGMTFIEIPYGNFVMGRYDLACPDEHPATTPIGGPLNWTSADHARCRADALKAYRPGFVAEVRKPLFVPSLPVTSQEWEQSDASAVNAQGRRSRNLPMTA